VTVIQSLIEIGLKALSLGEQLTGDTSSTDATSGGSDVGSTGGLASDLTSLFNAFQDLSTAPDSMTSRQTVLAQAQQL
jgi:hypothetical protein